MPGLPHQEGAELVPSRKRLLREDSEESLASPRKHKTVVGDGMGAQDNGSFVSQPVFNYELWIADARSSVL